MNKLLLLLIFIGLCSFSGAVKNNWLCGELMKGRVNYIVEYCKSNKVNFRSATTYVLDTFGNKIVEKNFYETDSAFKMDVKTAYKYNSKGNKVEENQYNPDGTASWEITFTYDENDNVIESNRYRGADDHIEKRTKYMYDSLGNNIEKIIFNGEKLSSELKCIYDAENRKIEEFTGDIPDQTSGKSSREIWRYYMNGQLYADSLYEGENLTGSVTFYSLKFDSVGNWIKRTAVIHKSHIPVDDTEVLTRKIVYY